MMLPEATSPSRVQLQALHQLTSAVIAADGPARVHEAALQCLADCLDVSRSAVLLFDEDGVMRFKAWRNLSQTYRNAVEGHSPWTIDTVDPEPVLVEDVRREPSLAHLLPAIESEGIGSLAFVPLISGGHLAGKFMVYHPAPHHFDDAEVMIAEIIGGQVGFALEQLRATAAEAALRTSEDRYQVLLQSLGLAVYTTDAEGYIELFNEAAVDLWGRRPEPGRDMWCGSWQIYHLDGRRMPHEDCPMGVALKEDRRVRGEIIRVARPDGGWATVMPYPTPLHNSAGDLVGAVNVLVDITELQQIQAELEEAVRARDDFLGLVSHELRTPLTQLVGNAEILMRRWSDLSPETSQESLDALHFEALRLQRLVENMTVLSRIERGIANAEPQLVQRLLVKTVDEFRLRHPDTEIVIRINEPLLPAEVSASTIDQVAWNLLTNARKYGPTGGPIEVDARMKDGYVVVSVRDQGHGVPEQDVEHIFEPYFRSSSTAAANPGLGLGLSVCKRLVEAQGGIMNARLLQPKGMEFTMRLPAIGTDFFDE